MLVPCCGDKGIRFLKTAFPVLLFSLFFLVHPGFASNQVFEQFTTYTVEGLNLDMSLTEAENELQQKGYTRKGKSWVILDGGRRKNRVTLQAAGESLRKIMVEFRLPKNSPFNPEQEVQRIRSHFSGAVVYKLDRIGSRGGSGEISIAGQRTSPYSLRINLRPVNKSYQLIYNDYAAKQYVQKKQEKANSGITFCRNADPSSFDAVFQCMSKMRSPSGSSLFNNIGAWECRAIWGIYRKGLMDAGVPRDQIEAHRPDCSLFARAAFEITGKPAYWSACLNYQGTTPEHARTCLETFIPSYYGKDKQKGPQEAGNCEKISRDYRLALAAASPDANLPANYSPLGCEEVNRLIVAWNPQAKSKLQGCEGYSPEHSQEHLEQCLSTEGRQLARLEDCIQVRELYEKRLRESYGGLPKGYQMLRCSYAEPILAKAQAIREEILEERRNEMARREKQRAERIAASNRYWQEKFTDAREIIEKLDVRRGPVVPMENVATLAEGVSSHFHLGNLSDYQQPGLLTALFANKPDLIQPRRGAALTYINAFHAAYAHAKTPSCRLASDPQIGQILQGAIMTELGFNKFLSSDVEDAGMLSIGVVLSMLAEMKGKGMGPMMERQQNIELIKEQAYHDALRMAQAPDCNQVTAKALFYRAVEFVNSAP